MQRDIIVVENDLPVYGDSTALLSCNDAFTCNICLVNEQSPTKGGGGGGGQLNFLFFKFLFMEDLIECYNSTLTDILEKHAPLKEKVVRLQPHAPWYNNEIQKAKRERRKWERKYKKVETMLMPRY